VVYYSVGVSIFAGLDRMVGTFAPRGLGFILSLDIVYNRFL